MNIAINFSNEFIAEVIAQHLITNAYDDVVVDGRSPADGFAPQLLLVDIATLAYDLLARYPEATTFLIDDIGMEAEKLCAALDSYKTDGVLTPHAGLHQVWIENDSVKAVRHDTGALSQTRKQARSRAGQKRSSSASAMD